MSAASLSVIAAYASDVSQPAQRARSHGQTSAAFGLGFICGPMLGGLLGSIDIRLPFAVAGALSALNLVHGALFIPESLPAARRLKSPWRGANPVAPMLQVLRDPRCGAAACLLFGLATRGWMMYAVMPLNLLAFGVAPTLQSIVSKACAEQEQGVVMGSLQSIGSLGVFIIPLLGAGLLQNTTHLAPRSCRPSQRPGRCAASAERPRVFRSCPLVASKCPHSPTFVPGSDAF